jgi:hypothetical protein
MGADSEGPTSKAENNFLDPNPVAKGFSQDSACATEIVSAQLPPKPPRKQGPKMRSPG